MKDEQSIRIEYNNCLDLCGVVIKRAMEQYTYAYYKQLKGREVYRHPKIFELKCYTKAEIEKYENFFTGEGIEFWGQGLINGDYLMEYARKEARKRYDMEERVKRMESEDIDLLIKICKKELYKRAKKSKAAETAEQEITSDNQE